MSNINIENFKDTFNPIFLSLVKDGHIMMSSGYKLGASLREDYVYNSKNRGDVGMAFYKVNIKRKRVIVAELSFAVIYDIPTNNISAYSVKTHIKDSSVNSKVRYLDSTNSTEYSTPYVDVDDVSIEDLILEIISFMSNCIMYTEYYLINADSVGSNERWKLEDGVLIENEMSSLKGFTKFLMSSSTD